MSQPITDTFIRHHGRLIYMNGRKEGVTHHTCPKNGQVHDGHPSECENAHCYEWATGERHPAYIGMQIFSVILLILIALGLITICIIQWKLL